MERKSFWSMRLAAWCCAGWWVSARCWVLRGHPLVGVFSVAVYRLGRLTLPVVGVVAVGGWWCGCVLSVA